MNIGSIFAEVVNNQFRRRTPGSGRPRSFRTRIRLPQSQFYDVQCDAVMTSSRHKEWRTVFVAAVSTGTKSGTIAQEMPGKNAGKVACISGSWSVVTVRQSAAHLHFSRVAFRQVNLELRYFRQ